MTQKITFQKSGEIDNFQKLKPEEGTKLGLKEIDEWLAKPATYWEYDWIFRVKVVPFELSLNGKKRKIKTIDFFCNANTGLDFFLTNALKNETTFELQWMEEHIGKGIGFSENRPNALVVSGNTLHYGCNKEEREKIKQNSDRRDLEVNWKNINLLEWGLSFDLISLSSISLDSRNFTYDKVFLPLDFPWDKYEWIKKRLTEWKENNKPLIIKNAILSTKSWLSAKNGNILYVVDDEDFEELSDELAAETRFGNEIGSDWDKLPYQQKIKFIERCFKGKEKIEDMKNEIEATIQALENGDNKPDSTPPPPNPKQNKPPKNNTPHQIPWEIIIPAISLFIIGAIVVGVIIVKKKKKKTQSIIK